MDVAKCGPQPVIEVVVLPYQFLAPVRRLRGSCSVHVSRSSRRIRNHSQKRSRVRINRNLVIGKRVVELDLIRVQNSQAGRRAIRKKWSRCTSRIIPLKLRSRRRTKITEISAALRQRGNNLIETLPRNPIPPPFLRPEKERLVLIRVVNPGNVNRTTNRVSPIVFLLRGNAGLKC